MTTVAFDLHAERVNRGLSLRRAGSQMGIAPNTLKQAENGSTTVHPGTAKKIADFYGVKVTDIWPLVETRAA